MKDAVDVLNEKVEKLISEKDHLIDKCHNYLMEIDNLQTQADSLKQINKDLYVKHIQLRGITENLHDQILKALTTGHIHFDLRNVSKELYGKAEENV